jgi:IS5 family transposase
MNQRTLAGFEKYGKVTRRAQFLADMEHVMPWDKLTGLIGPHQAFRRNGRIDERIREANRLKSKVRARVEHVFGTIKRVFGFRKVRFRGLFKNRHHVRMLAALANLFTLRRRLLAT